MGPSNQPPHAPAARMLQQQPAADARGGRGQLRWSLKPQGLGALWRPLASEQHCSGTAAITMLPMAVVRRTGVGAAVPQPAHHWFGGSRRGIMGMLVRRQLVLHNRLEKVDPACTNTETALARIEPPLRPTLPARSAAGLQQRQHRQPLPRAARAVADRQRR